MGPRKRRSSAARPYAKMNIIARAFTPTANRRLNELIGFLVFVFAVLLVLALVSYSPLDPSLNTAANPPAGRPAHNWIGVVGAMVSDLAWQLFGVAVFLIPVFLLLYSLRWFRSRPISSPYAKTAGRDCVVHLPLRTDRTPALEPSLEGRNPCRRPARPHRRGRADSLLQPRRCVSHLSGRDRRRALSLDGLFLRRNPDLVANPLVICLCRAGSLCRLARRTRAQEGGQRTGEEARRRRQCQASRNRATGSATRRRRSGTTLNSAARRCVGFRATNCCGWWR